MRNELFKYRGLADEPGSDPVDALFDAALELSDDSGDRALEVRIAANRVYMQWRAGDLVGMEASVAGELARLDRSGLAEAAGGQLLVARAVALHGLGRWGSLADHLEATLARRERLGAQVELLLRLVAIELAADLGRVAEARAGLADLEAHPAFADPEVSYEVMAVRLGIATIAGDLPRGAAGALVDEAVQLAGRIVGDPFAAARVRVAGLRLLATATQRTGGPLGVAGVPGHESAAGPDPGRSSEGHAGPAELRALHAEEHAWRCGEGWAAAIAAWDALPMPHRRAWAQVWAAHAEARDGRVPPALQLADAARGTAEELGAVPLGQAAERLLRQLGRRSGRTEGALTSRERDVLAEVARGQTNREIGRALGMSERTVAVHLSRIFAKLGAGTRGEAVLVARHLGEIL